VFEIGPQWLVKAAAYRGRWIDQSQSLNIFYGGTSGKVLSEIYQYAWSLGLKTTYYLRTLGASRIEKSTINLAKFGSTSKTDGPVASGTTANAPQTVTIEEIVTITETTLSPVSESVLSPVTVNAQGDVTFAQAPRKQSTPMLTASVARDTPLNTATATLTVPLENSFAQASSDRLSQLLAEEAAKNAGTLRPKVEVIGETCESCSA